MRSPLMAGFFGLAVGLAVAGCGGGGTSGPTGPSGTGGASQVTIVGDRGQQSFTPNPASAGQGQMVVWRNNDNLVHRIVFNDGSRDTGDIAAGVTSAAIPVPAEGTNYHCSIHPTMVGAINASGGGRPPACEGAYC